MTWDKSTLISVSCIHHITYCVYWSSALCNNYLLPKPKYKTTNSSKITASLENRGRRHTEISSQGACKCICQVCKAYTEVVLWEYIVSWSLSNLCRSSLMYTQWQNLWKCVSDSVPIVKYYMTILIDVVALHICY